MSIQTEIARIRQAKNDIILQLKAKGVDVPDNITIDEIAVIVANMDVGTSEDLSTELATQSTLLATQTNKLKDIRLILQNRVSFDVVLNLNEGTSVSDDNEGNVVITGNITVSDDNEGNVVIG